jgi:outer membrane immunogenic protein
VPPVLVADWSGIYVGLEGGYGWGRQTNATAPFLLDPKFGDIQFDPDFTGDKAFEFREFQSTLHDNRTGADVLLGKVKQKGWLFGGFFGAQKQWGSWVFGIEGDVDAANMKGSVAGSTSVNLGGPNGANLADQDEFLNLKNNAALESKIDMLASLRGKVGFVPAPNWLIYGTGGAAFAHVKNSLAVSQSLAYGDDPYANDCEGANSPFCVSVQAAHAFTASAGTSMFGWAAGAGVDWKLPVDAGSAWVFGIEYLHYGFPDQTITFNGPNGGSFSFTGKENVDTIKGRISYLFSIH